MKTQSLFRAALAGALASGLLPGALSGTANAQPPSVLQPFTTQIFIQNPNSAGATVVVNFYTELTGALQSVAPTYNLNANGSTIVLVGSLSLSSGWRGSAVISADQPVVAASMQVPATGYGHIMANAFTSGEASSNVFLTTFLGRGNATNAVSFFAVQNTEGEPINIRARFINPVGTEVLAVNVPLPAFASKFFDGYEYTTTIGAGLGWAFNGSVVVTATKQSNGQPAFIVGTVEERRVEPSGNARFRAYGFEAIPQSAAATTIYMPTALCRSGSGNPTTFFAIQNTGSATAVVTVTYATGSGTTPSTQVNNSLAPFAKWAVDPCQGNGNQTYSGAAVIQSTQPIAAVGKASQTSGTFARYTTAYLAQSSGSRRVAVPYVRWSPSSPGTDFRTNIAIQNIGSASIPAGQLVVRYYAPNGTLVNTCTSVPAMAAGAKLNTNVAGAFFTSDFNCTTTQPSNGASYSFTGSAVIEGPAGSQLLAVARNSTPATSTQIHTEDFNANNLP